MNIEEKREKVTEYCNGRDCENCRLEVGHWLKPLNRSYNSCLNIADSPEKDLDRALQIIGVDIEKDNEKNGIIAIKNNNSWVDLVGILLNNGYEVNIRPTKDYKNLEIKYRKNETEGLE